MPEQQEKLEFKIARIDILNFSMNNPLKPEDVPTGFVFNISFEQQVSLEQKIVGMTLSIGIEGQNNQFNTGSLKVAVFYEVQSLESHLVQKGKFRQLSDGVNEIFASIAISTARGILYTMGVGTILQSAILPIINPADLTMEIKQATK